MSSNIPLIQPKEDQIKDAIGNLKTDEQKASDSDFEKPLSEDTEKCMALNKLISFDKSRSISRTETEDTVTLYTEKISISSASSDDKNIKEQHPTEIRFFLNLIPVGCCSLIFLSSELDDEIDFF